MITPKFVYNPGSGVTTLSPTYPAKDKYPVDGLQAVRHDSYTSSGKLQSIVERIDGVITLKFPFVPLADLAAWYAFMGYALTGGQFDYYDDATSGIHETYHLADQGWDPKWIAPGYYTFTLKMRKWVS